MLTAEERALILSLFLVVPILLAGIATVWRRTRVHGALLTSLWICALWGFAAFLAPLSNHIAFRTLPAQDTLMWTMIGCGAASWVIFFVLLFRASRGRS